VQNERTERGCEAASFLSPSSNRVQGWEQLREK
jgi:hypothetical protein